jgi:hypothetical protein
MVVALLFSLDELQSRCKCGVGNRGEQKMKKNMPPALVELIAHPEANRVEEQVLALARGIRDEGIPLRSITRGLAGAICTLIDEEYMKGHEEFLWAKHFLRELESGFGNWRESVEHIEDIADEIERSRAAGGTGKPYQ